VAPTPVAYPLTLTDDEQNQVVLKAEPRRIVSITPATTEILFALGIGDRLIANTDADDYPAQVKSLPHVATFNSVDVEKIVSLNADLVIAGGNGFNKPDSLAQLRRLGIPVLVVYGADVEGVLHDFQLVATAVNRTEAGQGLVAATRAEFQRIAQATAALPHPRTFYELDATKEIYGPADKSFIAEMITLAGGTPITTGSTTVFSIPLEKLVQADPEVIVLGDSAYGTTADLVKARPGWNTMTAVKNGAIRPIDDTVVTRPGPRLAEGLRDLALAIHPDLVLAEPSSTPSPSAGASTAASPAAGSAVPSASGAASPSGY
jgi:iron complex transport system substrate-binding protein